MRLPTARLDLTQPPQSTHAMGEKHAGGRHALKLEGVAIILCSAPDGEARERGGDV